MNLKRVSPGVWVEKSNKINIVPHPDPCWLIKVEESGGILGCSAKGLLRGKEKELMIAFYNKETTDKYIERIGLKNGASICMRWNDIIDRFGKFFDGVIVNPPIEFDFCCVAPLKKDEYYTYCM
ncbi:MAG: hypothetical protein AAB516_01595 [Patescibacteria group bacterium]